MKIYVFEYEKKALLMIKAVPLNTIFSYSTILYHADFYSQ